jgi:hypothetical protein
MNSDSIAKLPQTLESPKAAPRVVEDLTSRPSFKGKSKCHTRIKKTQRYLSDCSMGQHYHVFFHKRRYSYGSPVCGFFSLIIYAALLFYITIKFKGVILKPTLINVEEYKPIDFTNYTSLTIYSFLNSTEL